MTFSPKPRRALDPAIPLINLVFLLMAFFLIAAQIAPQDTPLPRAPAPPFQGEAHFSIDESNQIFYGSRPLQPSQIEVALADFSTTREPLIIRAAASASASRLFLFLQDAQAANIPAALLITSRAEVAPPLKQNK